MHSRVPVARSPRRGTRTLLGSVLVKQELLGSHPICSPTTALSDGGHAPSLRYGALGAISARRKGESPTACTVPQLPPPAGVNRHCRSTRLQRENQKKPLGQLPTLRATFLASQLPLLHLQYKGEAAGVCERHSGLRRQTIGVGGREATYRSWLSPRAAGLPRSTTVGRGGFQQ